MLSEFFVQACEEISLIVAFALFLITAAYAFFQWNKGKRKTLISHIGSHIGFVEDSGYADTSLNDNGERYDSSQSASNDNLDEDEKASLKLGVDAGLSVKSKEESLPIPSMELTYPEMLTEAVGRRNYSAIGRMADRGLATAQIANELGIPKGEVDLVLKLKALYGGGYNMSFPLETTFRAAS